MTPVWISNTHFPGAPQMQRDKLYSPTELGFHCLTVPSLSSHNTPESCLNSPGTALEFGTDFGTEQGH